MHQLISAQTTTITADQNSLVPKLYFLVLVAVIGGFKKFLYFILVKHIQNILFLSFLSFQVDVDALVVVLF